MRRVLILVVLALAGCGVGAPSPAPTPVPLTASILRVGGLPSRLLTPGAVQTSDLNVVCHQSTSLRRSVSAALRSAVWKAYGVTVHTGATHEVDHLIPLELGGDNVLANLWPQPALPLPGFHQKDVLENVLHARVCRTHTMTLAVAQRLIATDWVAAYRQYVPVH